MTLLHNIGTYWSWADTTIWNIVQGLTDEEFSRNLYDGGGSIRQRYVHLAEDLWEWYFDWIGQNPGDEPDFRGMTREELNKSIGEYTQMFINMIEDRPVNHIEMDTIKEKLRINYEEILFHLVNHATYHRGQIVMSLRILGKKVVMTDYVPHRIQITEQG
ncbi:MAG: hypothetical protein KAJ36_00060 [Candidatus Thorarchaeota archaeon]|nr:hypothetical protein [Candidatus Thorarchaeota archaeon]MCK5388853.1 hypothetical protein [Candidatus Thorarchaeota archaeon]